MSAIEGRVQAQFGQQSFDVSHHNISAKWLARQLEEGCHWGGLFHPVGLYKVPCSACTVDLGARATNDHIDTLSNRVCFAGPKMDGNIS